MIGNDVVDLADPDADPGRLHPRFDGRVFDPSERALIAASTQPSRTRWILWALKESAYKAARKEEPTIVFSPARFVVSHQEAASAIVCACGRRFRASISCGPGYVHAVAWQRSEEHTSDLQSRENNVCRLLLEKKKKKNHVTPQQQKKKKKIKNKRNISKS